MFVGFFLAWEFLAGTFKRRRLDQVQDCNFACLNDSTESKRFTDVIALRWSGFGYIFGVVALFFGGWALICFIKLPFYCSCLSFIISIKSREKTVLTPKKTWRLMFLFASISRGMLRKSRLDRHENANAIKTARAVSDRHFTSVAPIKHMIRANTELFLY